MKQQIEWKLTAENIWALTFVPDETPNQWNQVFILENEVQRSLDLRIFIYK